MLTSFSEVQALSIGLPSCPMPWPLLSYYDFELLCLCGQLLASQPDRPSPSPEHRLLITVLQLGLVLKPASEGLHQW